MRVRCKDGVVRVFHKAYTDGERLKNSKRVSGNHEAMCSHCLEEFGVHDAKVLRPLFREHCCDKGYNVIDVGPKR